MQKLILQQVQWYPSQRAGQADSTVTDVSGGKKVGDHKRAGEIEPTVCIVSADSKKGRKGQAGR